jgi:hypothetical protein
MSQARIAGKEHIDLVLCAWNVVTHFDAAAAPAREFGVADFIHVPWCI